MSKSFMLSKINEHPVLKAPGVSGTTPVVDGEGRFFASQGEAARALKVAASTISRMVHTGSSVRGHTARRATEKEIRTWLAEHGDGETTKTTTTKRGAEMTTTTKDGATPEYTFAVNSKGYPILKHSGSGGILTPVVDSTGRFFVSQLEASKAFKCHSSRINDAVRRHNPIEGVAVRYATEDEVLDWLTRPVGSEWKAKAPVTGTAGAVRDGILSSHLRQQLRDAQERLSEALGEIATLRAARSRQNGGGFAIEGFEFPGGPVIVRIKSSPPVTIVRDRREELPEELLSACKWHKV